jgi:non-ribosomal peptide synthase protein (TIGR01720 family)
VKFRGFRIEMGEIEAVLTQHPDVAQACALVREDIPGQKQLVGYLVAATGHTIDPLALRLTLSEKLPHYMVPAALVVLQRIPLTTTGKLDRKALPAPEFTAPTCRAPRTPQEETLAVLFAAVLGLESVGIDDNFFELGGDSISSIQLVTRARKAGLTLTPRQVFQHQNVAALASVTRSSWEDARPRMHAAIGPLLPSPSMLEWISDADTGTQPDLQDRLWLQLPLDATHERLSAALQTVLDKHDALRMYAARKHADEVWQFEIPPPGHISAESCLQYIDAQTWSEDVWQPHAEAVAAAAAGRLDPANGIMLQAVWFGAGAVSSRLLLVAHPLVVDDTSWLILAEDLCHAYERTHPGHSVSLEADSISLRNHLALLHEEAHDPARAAELQQWIRHSRHVAWVPTNQTPRARQTAGAREFRCVSLSTALSDAVLYRVPQLFRADPEDALLTGMILAASAWQRAKNGEPLSTLQVECTCSGRETQHDAPRASRTVGRLAHRFPIAFDLEPLDVDQALAGGAAIGQALKHVKEQRRQIPGHGSGFGLLRYINGETAKHLAGSTPPQVGFRHRSPAGSSPDRGCAPFDRLNLGIGNHAPCPATHLVDVESSVASCGAKSVLIVTWSWVKDALAATELDRLIELWLDALQALADYAQTHDIGGSTASDHPLAQALPQAEIELLEAMFAQT